MPISMDHEAYLGDTVEKIAFEKAGIIKRRCPVVIGQQPFAGAKDTLIALAEKAGGPLAVYGQEFLAFEEHGRMVYQDEDGLLDLPKPAPGRPPPDRQRGGGNQSRADGGVQCVRRSG